MRHSDPRLTAVTYNDATLLPVAAAISELPSLEDKSNYTHIRTHVLGAEGQNLSQPDAQQLRNKERDPLEDKDQRLDLAHNDSESHSIGNGSCGWIRTNDLVVNSHPLYR